MDMFVHYLDANAMAILFNVVLLAIIYLIARLGRARPLAALASGFLPLYGLIVLGAALAQSGPSPV